MPDRYTLAEAKKILGRQECEEKGFHRWEVAMTPMLPTEIKCVRCDLSGKVTFEEGSMAEDVSYLAGSEPGEIFHLIELPGVYDGWSIAVHKDGSLHNRWADEDGKPIPGYEGRFYKTQQQIALMQAKGH